jgi:hypothetical protein
MNAAEARVAGEQLGFPIPAGYCQYMAAHRDRLLAVPEIAPDPEGLISGGLAVTGPALISIHEGAVAAADCVEEECREWFEEYVTIADNGGGGFYFLRRDNAPEVYLMDSDWMEEPHIVSSSLGEFVDSIIQGDWPE